MVIVVDTKSPIKDWAGMLANLHAEPGHAHYRPPRQRQHQPPGVLHLQKALGVSFNIIPYKSNGHALNDLLAGQIDAVIDQVPASIGHVRGGRLRAVG